MQVSENNLPLKTTVTVRRAEMGDFAAVTTLLAELGRPVLTPENAAGVEAVYRRHIADLKAGSLVAEVDGLVIGFLSLVFREHLNFASPQAWIPDLIVTESARGNGRRGHYWTQRFWRHWRLGASLSGCSRATGGRSRIGCMRRSA